MLPSLALCFYLAALTSNATTYTATDSVSTEDIVITLNINTDTDIIDITMTNIPSDRWFGIGFGNKTMTNTYSIVISETDGTNTATEHILGSHNAGSKLVSTINIENDETVNNERSITIKRNRTGFSENYYTFPGVATDMDIIWAFSASGLLSFGYHGNVSSNSHSTSILRLTSNKTAENETTQSGLFGFKTFDFVNYRLYDWIVFSGLIILLCLCCFSCFWCYRHMESSIIPASIMNAKTGSSRISIFQRRNPGPNESIRPEIGLFQYTTNQSVSSPDENDPNAPQQATVYKAKYATSPMRHEWNNAFNAAANAKLNIVGDQDEIGGGGGRRHKKAASQASLAFSTVSFGKPIATDKLDIPTDLIHITEEKESDYYDYEEQEFDHLDDDADRNRNNQYEASV